jgi:hypothetical protein
MNDPGRKWSSCNALRDWRKCSEALVVADVVDAVVLVVGVDVRVPAGDGIVFGAVICLLDLHLLVAGDSIALFEAGDDGKNGEIRKLACGGG